MHISTINFICFFILYISKNYHFYPPFICSSIGIISPWIFIQYYEPPFVQRMLIKNNWGLSQFIIGDLLLHYLPVCYSIFVIANKNVLFANKTTDVYQYCGMYGILLHLVWIILSQNGFYLGNAYVDLPDSTMRYLWTINIFSQIFTMYMLNS